jgi:hypothetical protein
LDCGQINGGTIKPPRRPTNPRKKLHKNVVLTIIFKEFITSRPNGSELSHSGRNRRLERGAALNPKAGRLLVPAID